MKEEAYRLANGTALPGLHRDVVEESANELLLLMGWQDRLTGPQLGAFHDAYALSVNGLDARRARRQKQERIRRDVARQYGEPAQIIPAEPTGGHS
jgi:hypothetical protein